MRHDCSGVGYSIIIYIILYVCLFVQYSTVYTVQYCTVLRYSDTDSDSIYSTVLYCMYSVLYEYSTVLYSSATVQY